jgi:hypothetical protein
MQETTLLEFVIIGLRRHKGAWVAIARETGVNYKTICNIVNGVSEDPGVRKCEALAKNIRLRDEQALARQGTTFTSVRTPA